MFQAVSPPDITYAYPSGQILEPKGSYEIYCYVARPFEPVRVWVEIDHNKDGTIDENRALILTETMHEDLKYSITWTAPSKKMVIQFTWWAEDALGKLGWKKTFAYIETSAFVPESWTIYDWMKILGAALVVLGLVLKR